MNGKDKPPSEDDLIKNIMQDAFGMSSRECLKEYEEAEEHPDLSPELQAPSNGYQRIKDIIDLEGIPSYAETKGNKIVRIKKIMRPLVAVAIIGSVMWIFAMGAAGQKFYGYRSRIRSDIGNNVVWNNDSALVKVTAEEEAYEAIYEQLGIAVIQLSYKADGMQFEKVIIENGHSNMQFLYGDAIINFSQVNSNVAKSDNIISDPNESQEIPNEWLQKDINTNHHIIDSNSVEYNAILEIDGEIYHLYGVFDDENEFIKIVQGLSFYKK